MPNNIYEDRWPNIHPPFKVWQFYAHGTDHHELTWGILKNVLEGLRLYLTEGGHNRQAYFKIERNVDGILEHVGSGSLYRTRN